MFKFDTIGINNVDSINFDYSKQNEKTLWRPLFHGTTLYAISQNHEQIEEMFKHCKRILNTIGKYFYENRFDRNICDYMNSGKNGIFYLAVYSDKVSNFEHDGSLFLTDSIQNAIDYSNTSEFGEVGRFANSLIQAVEDLGYIIKSPAVKKSILFVKNEIKKYKNSPKIILVFEDVDFIDLKTESGYPLVSDNKTHTNHLIARANKFTQYSRFSYRLYPMVDYKYIAKIIPEDMFDSAVEKFTNYTKIDKNSSFSYEK